MLTFKQKLMVEYPIPMSISIWGGDGTEVSPIESLNNLIESCIDELSSDVLVTAYIEANNMTTQLPDDAVYVVSAKLNFNFQGNRMVKVSYDANSKKAFVRYFPAIITYRKRLALSDLDDLKGDMLIFTKSYMLWKMSQKELQILKAVDLDADNGKVDLTVLKEFSDSMLQKYNELKPEILLYATAN